MMYINKRKVCLRLILIAIISFFAFAFTACDEVALEKIHLTGVPENVTVGDVFEVEVIFEPENATDTTFSWSTPTPNLIEMEIVDTIAVITAKSVGTAMIVVTARDGNLVRTQSFEIYPNSLALTIGDANGIVEREYNNLPQGVIAGGAPGDVEIEYTYKLQGSLDIPSTTPPTNVGTYDVVARIVNSNFSGMGTGTLIIKKQDLIVTANDLSKTYGESDGGLTRIVSKGKLYEGVTISGSLKREVGEDVGEYDIIEDEPFTLAGDKKDNYNLIFQKGTFTILPKRLDITVMNKASQYGLELVPLTYTASGFINGDDESVIKGKLSLPDDAKNAGTYNIIVALTAENYTISANNAKYIITKAPITVTANNKTKIYGDLTPSLDYTIKNTSNASDTTKLFYQDTLSGELAIFDDINVGQQQITKGTLNNDNYTIAFVSGILDIVPREVEIEITTNLSKVYGESDLAEFDYIVTDSKNTLVAGDKITGMFGRELGEDVGEYELNLGTLSAGTNYILSLKAGVFTISQREIEISIHNESIIYGEPLSNIAYDIVGELAFNERLEFIFPNVDDYKNVGTYENVSYTSVKILNASDEEKQSNYKIKNTVGTIIITKRPIEVVCKDSEQVYGDGENILLYSIINNGVLAYNDEFSGEIVREQGKNVGEYVISQGTLALNDNYDLTVINGVYKIVPRAVEIEITSGISKVYGEQDPQTFDYQVVSDNNIIDGDSLSGMFGRELGEDVGEYQLNIGTLSLGDNYILTLKDGVFTISKRIVQININNASKTVGEDDPIFTWQYATDSLEILNDDVQITLTREIGEEVGTYTISYESINGKIENYDITINSAIFTINELTGMTNNSN